MSRQAQKKEKWGFSSRKNKHENKMFRCDFFPNLKIAMKWEHCAQYFISFGELVLVFLGLQTYCSQGSKTLSIIQKATGFRNHIKEIAQLAQKKLKYHLLGGMTL